MLSPGKDCTRCGGKLRTLGEDGETLSAIGPGQWSSEELEYVPGRFVVNRIVRPRKACAGYEAIVQSPLPSRPIEHGRPAPGLLAHVLVSKYADHLPLYCQRQIYAREGIDLDRSTLADWVGRSTARLEPLAPSWQNCCAMRLPRNDRSENWMVAGSEGGGKAMAIAFTLIETAKLNGVDPQAWLTWGLAHIADHNITHLNERLPGRYAAQAAQQNARPSNRSGSTERHVWCLFSRLAHCSGDLVCWTSGHGIEATPEILRRSALLAVPCDRLAVRHLQLVRGCSWSV